MSNYNEFCKNKKCPNYKQWEFYGKKLFSCALVGESDNIDKYPANCLFINEIKGEAKK
jgi:hypothetical protein